MPTVDVLLKLMFFFQLKTVRICIPEYIKPFCGLPTFETTPGQWTKGPPGCSWERWERCDRQQEQRRSESQRVGWLFEELRCTYENRFTSCADEWSLWVIPWEKVTKYSLPNVLVFSFGQVLSDNEKLKRTERYFTASLHYWRVWDPSHSLLLSDQRPMLFLREYRVP